MMRRSFITFREDDCVAREFTVYFRDRVVFVINFARYFDGRNVITYMRGN